MRCSCGPGTILSSAYYIILYYIMCIYMYIHVICAFGWLLEFIYGRSGNYSWTLLSWSHCSCMYTFTSFVSHNTYAFVHTDLHPHTTPDMYSFMQSYTHSYANRRRGIYWRWTGTFSLKKRPKTCPTPRSCNWTRRAGECV